MTTAKKVEEYILAYPSVRDCLTKGLINFAALGRTIVEELGSEVSSFEAVVISLRRLQEKLVKTAHGKDIINVLKNSTLEVKNKICAVTIEKEGFSEIIVEIETAVRKEKRLFFAIEGTGVITFIFQTADLVMIKKRFNRSIVSVLENMSLISLHCSSVQEVPGVLAYLTGLFYDYNVNLYNVMSCWNDNLFVVKTEDVGKVIGFLEF